MPNFLAQVTFSKDSLVPADACVNTFTFNHALAHTAAVRNDIIQRVKDFYDTLAPGGGVRVLSLMSSEIDPALTRIKLFDLSEPSPRAPIANALTPMGVTGTSGLPSEVAVALSFQALQVSGVSQARRRGRVYIGPLSTAATTSTTPTRPSAGIRDALAAAGEQLMVTGGIAIPATAEVSATWVVYSQVNGTSVPVNNGWVDDAFDIQRRRGVEPTTRTIFI